MYETCKEFLNDKNKTYIKLKELQRNSQKEQIKKCKKEKYKLINPGSACNRATCDEH